MVPTKPRARFHPRLSGLFSLAGAPSLPVTGDRHPLRRESARWLICGCAISVGLGILVAVVWHTITHLDVTTGSVPEIHLPRREFRPGVRGPVMVMGALAVKSGTDPVTQEGGRAGGARQAMPATETALVRGEIGLPMEPQISAENSGPTALAGSDSGTGTGGPGAVELNAPAQTNPCYVLRRLVRPEYPAGVAEDILRISQLRVEAAFFVDVKGEVTASYILQSEGGPLFDQAVLAAVNAWRFEPVVDPQCPPLGFWVRLPVVFHSPYALRPALSP